MSTCTEPLTIPPGFPLRFSQVAAAVDALIAVATEPLYVSNPVVDDNVICEEPLTTVSRFNLVLIVVSIEEVNEFKLPVDASNLSLIHI